MRSRQQRNQGPVKIRSELRQRGIAESLVQDVLDDGVEEGVWCMQKKVQLARGSMLWQWSVMILIALLVVGCGHRATHGIHHAKKSMKAPATALSEESTVVNTANAGQAKPFGSEGYFPDREGNFSDLLQEEPLIYEESPLGKGNLGASNDYWVNLHVLIPNDRSGGANFKVTCVP